MNASISGGHASIANVGKIYNYSNDILIVLSGDFTITLFNRQAEKLYGLSAEDILGKKYDKTCEHNKINCRELIDSIYNALSNKSQMSIEENLYDNIFIKWKIIPTETVENNELSIMLVGKDISEYHKINTELIKARLEAEKRNTLIDELENSIALVKTELRHEKDTRISLENLLAHMPGNVYWMDKNCIQLGCNDNVLTMLGLSRENYIGKTYEELSQIAHWPEGLAEKLKMDDIEVMRTGRPKFNIEDPPLPHSNGNSLHLLTSRVPLRDTENNIIGVAGISIDITERKKAEQELLRAKESAEAANKAKTEFVQNMQHDIRTPTSGLVGVLDVLVKAEEDTSKREIFEMAAAASKRLLNLCNEAVEFGDLSGNTRPVIQKKLDVRAVVRSIIDLNLPAAFAKNLVINFNVTASVPLHIASDEFRISRIVVNLLGNSIKFSHKGEITLSIDASVDEETRKGFLTIELRDMGIGIAPDKVHTIFEKFTRGVASNTNLYPGTGLGLYVVKTFIDELDGEIEEVESHPNEGTYFKLNIPFKALLDDMKKPGVEVKECLKSPINLTDLEIEEKQIPKAAIQKKSVAHGSFAHKLLIIEDDKTCLFAEKNLLSAFTHSIDTAENVAEALEKLSKNRYDLVISDLGLPDGSGNDIVAEIKSTPESKNYKTPFVAMTAHQDALKHKQAIDAGFTATNTKPLQAEKAAELLNTYPAQGTTFSPKKEPGLPVIDLNLALNRTGSQSESDMIELLKILWESLQVDIPILKKAEEDNDFAGVNAILLKIRGGLCYSGTPRLETACEVLYKETQNSTQNLNKIEYFFSELYDEAAIFSEQFKELIKGINVQKEAEQLRIENEKQKLLLNEEEKFRSLANKVAHDIRSPLASLLMVVRECPQIPENRRIALREAAMGIGDIANNLLYQYQKKSTDSYESEERQALLVSTALMELLTAKKYQYKNSPVKFDCHFNSNTQFAFVRIQPSAFKRMVSNLVNNAVDAFDNKAGQVMLQLDADNEWVKISIKDSGKGMSAEMINKIMNKTSFTEGKDSGHGIGLTQVWETLENNQGELHIDSKPGQGTTMTVTFPRTKAPSWIADEINLMKNDIVIILDDDTSIHGAWQTRFENIVNKRNNIQLKHFQIGKEALSFIHSLEAEDKARILLLSDYELLNQDLNGLHIIEKSHIKRSILVTSHYADALIRELSAKIGTKILPKQLASEISVKFVDDLTKVSTKVDAVLVEDDEGLSDKMVLYIFKDKTVDQYLNPEDLLKNIHRYAKDTKIYLDNNYDNSPEKGVDVAKKLHEQGYERLYLLSGDYFREGELPEYLTVIRKDDIDALEESVNS